MCRITEPAGGGYQPDVQRGTPHPERPHSLAHLLGRPGGRRRKPRAQSPRAHPEPAPQAREERCRGRHLALTPHGPAHSLPLDSPRPGAAANPHAEEGPVDGSPRGTEGCGELRQARLPDSSLCTGSRQLWHHSPSSLGNATASWPGQQSHPLLRSKAEVLKNPIIK
jgi:hypothetical protein